MNTQLINLLNNIQQALQQLDLWQTQPPHHTAFLSEQPFALDTMEAHEWLQWIFIPKIQAMIEANANLPRNFALHPYFEEIYKEQEEATALLSLIKQLDELMKD